MGAERKDGLNPHQQRRLLVTFQHVDKLLSEIEAILDAACSKSPFPRFLTDVTPLQRKTIADFINRIRLQLVQVLRSQGIDPGPPFIPATRAIRTDLSYIHIALEELKPHHMRGYGQVPPAAAAELNGVVGELHGLVSQLDRYIAEGNQL